MKTDSLHNRLETAGASSSAVPPTKTRWMGLGLVFFMTFLCSIDRANFSVCTTTIMSDLHLTPVQMGMMISAFALAYASLQIPGALWVRRYGTRVTVAIAVSLWSLFTFGTGLAAGFLSLIVARIFFGFGESPLFPAMNKYIFHWFPLKERAFANAIPHTGSVFSMVVAPPLIVWVLQLFGWRWVFYLCAGLGFLGAALWYYVTRNTPREHPGINEEELKCIESGRDAIAANRSAKVPWRTFFKFRSFWLIGLTYFCAIYMQQYFVYWLPFYLQNQLHMSLKKMGFAASVPWICIFICTMLVGRFSDWLVRSHRSLVVARNCIVAGGFAAAAIAMFISTFLTNPWAVVGLLSIALGFVGCCMAIPWAIASDIGGEYTGVISSWMNCWGQVGAATMGTATAYIGTRYGWNSTLIALVVIAGIGMVAAMAIRTERQLV